MEQDYPIHISEGENGPTWSFLTQTNVCGEVACHIQPLKTLELFINYIESEYVDDIFLRRIKSLIDEQGYSDEEANDLLQPLRMRAIQAYAEEALSYFRSKLPDAITDIFTALFFEAVQYALTTMSGKHLCRSDSPDTVLPFVRVVDREQLIKQVVVVSNNSAKKRMSARGKGRPRLEAAKVEGKVVKAIQRLHADNERISKAAVARQLHLGSEGSRTQALNNQLKHCNLDWGRLRRKAEVKQKI